MPLDDRKIRLRGSWLVSDNAAAAPDTEPSGTGFGEDTICHDLPDAI